MGRLLAAFGVVLTVCYLLFAWWLVGDRVLSLKMMALNEVGDFLAGVFGPLAILWLVLGFFQQGMELRQSTQALRMQADELKSSVTQQAAMVDVAHKQLESALATAKYDRELSEKTCEPHINFAFKHWLRKGEYIYAVFAVRNTGPRCTSLSVFYSMSDTDQLNLGFFEVFSEREEELEIPKLHLSRSEFRKISLSCTKVNGSQTFTSYGIQVITPLQGDERVNVIGA